jgi:hypothetical protein
MALSEFAWLANLLWILLWQNLNAAILFHFFQDIRTWMAEATMP